MEIRTKEQLDAAVAGYTKCLNQKFDGSNGKRAIVLCGGTGCLSSHSAEIKEKFEALIKEKNLGDKVTVNLTVLWSDDHTQKCCKGTEQRQQHDRICGCGNGLCILSNSEYPI